MRQKETRIRLPLMALAGLSLLAALWTGLARMGWDLPSIRLLPAGQHGAFMVSGFLGTLISLERAVALDQNRRLRAGGDRARTWFYYLAPLLSGLGAVALLLGLPPLVGQMAITLGALGLGVLFLIIYRMQPDMAGATMAIGVLCWLGGNLLWVAGAPLYRAVPWWAGFLVLTIAGERLEMARIMRWGERSRRLFVGMSVVLVAGLLLSVVAFDGGVRLAGVGLIGLGLWLLRFDIARRTVRKGGLTRFMAACLLPGYVWLVASGLLWIWFGGRFPAGPIYDALLHSLFLGFVISMIFGHAPVVLPAVLGIRLPYHPAFYVPLLLLHLSLVLRIVGDLWPYIPARQWGGLGNVTAVLLFLAIAILARLLAGESPTAPHNARGASQENLLIREV